MLSTDNVYKITSKQVKTFIDALFVPDDLIEVRRIPARVQTYHPADELPLHLERLIQQNANGQNVYAGVNPRKRRGGTAEDVAMARSVFVDFDGVTVEQARARLASTAFPLPTVIVNSGHGVHAYWSLLEPMHDLDGWRKIQQDLIGLLGTDPVVHDPPRLMRLPGFINHKPPAAPCLLVECDAKRRYAVDALRELIPAKVEKVRTTTSIMPATVRTAPVDGLVERVLRTALDKVRSGEGRNNSGHWLACQLRDNGVGEREAERVVMDFRTRCPECNVTGEMEPYTVPEVQATLRSVYRTPPREPWTSADADNRPDSTSRMQRSSTSTPSAPPVRKVDQYVPFPVELLPVVLRRFAVDSAEAIGCDVAYLATTLLVAGGAAIGNARRVRLKRGWIEPPVLWAGLVGCSGVLKSPALDAGVRPLRLRQELLFNQHALALADYRDAVRQWKARNRQDDEPLPPAPPERLLVGDVTVEALVDRLQHAPRGLLLHADELAGWFAGFNQYKSGGGADVPHWLSIHRAGPLIFDRKTGDKPTTYIPRAAVAVVGGIQPGTLRRVATDEFRENGLLARLLLVHPPRRPKTWSEAEVDVPVEQGLVDAFNALLDLRPGTDRDGNFDPIGVPLDEGAKRVWVQHVDALGIEQFRRHDDDLSAVWSKLEGGAARLALIVHQMRHVCGEKGVDGFVLDQQSIEAGIGLARWYGHEAERIYGMLAETADDRRRRELVDLIRARGGRISPRELQRHSRRYRTSDDARADLDGLVNAGIGRWTYTSPPENGGRQTEVFEFVDTVDADNRPSGDSESGRLSTSALSTGAEDGGGR